MLIIYFSQITILLKKNILIGIDKLNSRQLYSLLAYTHLFTPTSQKYLNELLKTDSLKLEVDISCNTFGSPWQLFSFLSIKNSEHCSLFKKKVFYFSKIDITSLSFLQTFWYHGTPSILRMQYNSKSMEWTRFILRKRIHSVWSNTAGCLFRFS